MLEMIYMGKISRYVNLVPILVKRREDDHFNYESVKLEAKKQLIENNIEWFDLQEDDLTFKQFKQNLLAQTTPFILSVKDQ